MTSLRLNTQFIGLPELQKALQKHRSEAVNRLQEVVSNRARDMKFHYQEAMDYEYTTGTGRLANSISFRTLRRENGVELRFYIKPYRELKYVTSLFGGHFQLFPVGRFPIYPRRKRRLAIKQDLPGGGRVTMRLIAPGQSVMWGTYTGGFSRDVLKEVSEEEAQFFLEDVYSAMADELDEMKAQYSRRRTSK